MRIWIKESNRIEFARSIAKMRDVLKSRKLHLEIRKCLVRCYELSIFLYASKSWTLNKQMEDKINAFEMWMFRISHLDRKTNVEVLEMTNGKTDASEDYTRGETTILGHLIRGNGKQNYWWKDRSKGQDAEESRERLGQVMWRTGSAWVIWNVLEWHKVKRDGVPWQPTFFEEDDTHSNRKWVLNSSLDFNFYMEK